MKSIKFSHNWNGKLDCPVFTTLRKLTQEKSDYYASSVGNRFDVFLNSRKYCSADLIEVDERQLIHVDDMLLMVDTGTTSRDEAMTVFEKFGLKARDWVIILLFQRRQSTSEWVGKVLLEKDGESP